MPPAPERLSTTTDLPRIFSSAEATGRAARSACPPGGNGTIMVMLRVGQACAPAGEISAPTAGAIRAPCRNLRRSMGSLRLDVVTLHHVTPAHHLGFQEIAKIGRRSGAELQAHRFHPFLCPRIVE